MSVIVTDNTDEVLSLFEAATLRGLEKCGLVGEGYAKENCAVDTGNLRNSISHKVDTEEKAVYIGTDVEYGPYVEFGTGIYAEGGGGRPTPWKYQDGKGNWYTTRGQKAQPFLRPAASEHSSEYAEILKSEYENA